MRPTRRGIVVITLIAGGIYMASEFGPRALNAVVGPALVTLVVAAVQVGVADRPEFGRQLPEPGTVGTDRSVDVAIETGSPISATVYDHVSEGLVATGNRLTTTIGAGPLAYDIHLDERGEHDIGPLDIVITDILGLFTRRFRFDTVDQFLVYPPAYQLDPAGSGVAVFSSVDRPYGDDEFAHLREYQRGDTLRDVDWKASAKRPNEELVVGEYVENSPRETVRIAVDSDTGDSDELATAAASLSCHLLDDGFEVGLGTHTSTIAPGTGVEHRRSLLAALARLSSGRPADETLERADLLVLVEHGTVTVRSEEIDVAFEKLVTDQRTDPVDDRLGRTEQGMVSRAAREVEAT